MCVYIYICMYIYIYVHIAIPEKIEYDLGKTLIHSVYYYSYSIYFRMVVCVCKYVIKLIKPSIEKSKAFLP